MQQAGFDGCVRLICYGHNKSTQEELAKNDGTQTYGQYSPPGEIDLYLTRTSHSKAPNRISARDELAVLLHELGHFLRHVRGRDVGFATARVMQDHKAYMSMPGEVSATRYARNQIAKLWPL